MHTQVPTKRSVSVGVRVCAHVFMCVWGTRVFVGDACVCARGCVAGAGSAPGGQGSAVRVAAGLAMLRGTGCRAAVP